MRALTRGVLAGSAYRALGLSALASEAQIEAAARRMRIWSNHDDIPPTLWDVPWLGPTGRSRSDIEWAVMRLREPASRLEERLLWYHTPSVVDPDHQREIAASIACEHALLVADLHRAAVNDAGVQHVQSWQAIVRRVNKFAGSADAAAWLRGGEQEGDFEKRASAEEIDASLQALADSLNGAIARAAEAALDQADFDRCARILGILCEANAVDGKNLHIHRILDRLEDNIYIHCDALERELHDGLDAVSIANMQSAAHCTKLFERNIQGPAGHFRMLAHGDPDRVMRVCSRCASLLTRLAYAWERAGGYIAAEKAFLQGPHFAIGTPAEGRLHAELARCRPFAEHERAGPSNMSGNIVIQSLGNDLHVMLVDERKGSTLTTIDLDRIRRQPSGVKPRRKRLKFSLSTVAWVVTAAMMIIPSLSAFLSRGPLGLPKPENVSRKSSSQYLNEPKMGLPTTLPRAGTESRDESIGETSREP